MKLYQAEWCPFSHRIRAKLTELGIDYEIVNVSASTKKREELEDVAGTKAIPVLVDGERVIIDSDEAISYLAVGSSFWTRRASKSFWRSGTPLGSSTGGCASWRERGR